eukprot:5555151-Pyramimonas_sp.AAC.1
MAEAVPFGDGLGQQGRLFVLWASVSPRRHGGNAWAPWRAFAHGHDGHVEVGRYGEGVQPLSRGA